MNENLKFCPKCKVFKSILEFYKSKKTKDKLRCYCKFCSKQDYSKYNAQRRWQREKDIPEYRRKRKINYHKNKIKILETNRIWRTKTFNGRLSSYKRSALQRNISWNLSNEEFSSFWQKPCSYCGQEIKTIGIDRKDNTIGYEINNCVSCCTICNKMKMKLTFNQFKNQILLIYDRICKR